nr:unnamed protein product [Callosobruchus analis]CAI5841186.1 unnamed protein product [Callosobruchus analis]CAI5847871.1 unnamed protein product [Callosobruchus analis]CAI5863895.1 unnamed protein product [Callosobruchus analis]
MPYCLKLKRN